MDIGQIIKYSLLAVLIVIVGGFLHYNLPRTDVVQITGIDTKRIDRKHATEGTRTRDVRYLNAVTPAGDVRVFRNEDTSWGWPPYFKFHSADLTAEAQLLIQEPEKPWVRVRYYGWRMNVFSLFPNAVSLKVVDKDYTHIPVFNIIFLALLALGGFLVVRYVRLLLDRLDASEHYRSATGSIAKLFGRDKP